MGGGGQKHYLVPLFTFVDLPIMSNHTIMNYMLTQINATLQRYASHFQQQDKTMASIKTSVNNMNNKMENTLLKSQNLDSHSDTNKSDPVETESFCTNCPQNVTKQEYEAFAKPLKIQSLVYDSGEIFNKLLLEHLVLLANSSPQKAILEFMYIYIQIASSPIALFWAN